MYGNETIFTKISVHPYVLSALEYLRQTSIPVGMMSAAPHFHSCALKVKTFGNPCNRSTIHTQKSYTNKFDMCSLCSFHHIVTAHFDCKL